MEKLSTVEINILEKEIKSRKLLHAILLGLTSVSIVLFSLSQYLQWGFPASFISGFLGGDLILFSLIHYFMSKKLVSDLTNGVKASFQNIFKRY